MFKDIFIFLAKDSELLMKRTVKRKIRLMFKDIFIFLAKDSKIHLQNYKILVKYPPK